MMELSPQIQNQIIQLKQLEAQIQTIGIQKQQIDIQLREAIEAAGALEKIEGETVIYSNIGNLMVKAKSKEEIISEIEEKKETLEIRSKTLKRQLDRLTEQYQALQDKLNQEINFLGAKGMTQ